MPCLESQYNIMSLYGVVLSDSCVKIYLMYEGKQQKRVKTTVRANDTNPVFNENFSFDVPQNCVEKVYFSLVICHYNGEHKGTKIMGRVYIGANFGRDAQELWQSMLSNPRKKLVKTFAIGSWRCFMSRKWPNNFEF